MGAVMVDVMFWLGIVLVVVFTIAGLASPRFRRWLQRPAVTMVRTDRAAFGPLDSYASHRRRNR